MEFVIKISVSRFSMDDQCYVDCKGSFFVLVIKIEASQRKQGQFHHFHNYQVKYFFSLFTNGFIEMLDPYNMGIDIFFLRLPLL